MTFRDTEPGQKPGSFLVALTLLAALFSAAVLAGAWFYLHDHDSNHTGHEPWLLLAVFVPTLALGIAAFRSRRSRWAALLACLLSSGGIVFLLYLDRFNVLLQYDRWLERGMP